MARCEELIALMDATGKTLDEFADFSGVSRSTLNRYRAGKIRQPKPREINFLAVALDMKPAVLKRMVIAAATAEEASPAALSTQMASQAAVDQDGASRRKLVLGAAASGALAMTAPLQRILMPGGSLLSAAVHNEAPSVGALKHMVEEAYRLRQGSQYAALGASLPSLLQNVYQLVDKPDSEASQLEGLSLSVQAHHVAAAYLKQTGRHDLAWLAIDRAATAAGQSGNPALRLACDYRLANLLLDLGQFSDAREVLQRALRAFDSTVASKDVSYAALWGATLLKNAAVAAAAGDASGAWCSLGEARTMARLVGEDRNDFWTAFGPTNVAIHEVHVGVQVGDEGRAIERAQAVQLESLPRTLVERRGRFLIDYARALAMAGRDEATLQTLIRADSLAPEDVRKDRYVADVTLGLLEKEQVSSLSSLRELAGRVGVER